MFSKIIAWIKGEVVSVETILANWFKAVQQLEQHAVAQIELADAHFKNALDLQAKVAQAHNAVAAAQAEADKAKAVAAQIKTIVTTDVAKATTVAAEVKSAASQVSTTIKS